MTCRGKVQRASGAIHLVAEQLLDETDLLNSFGDQNEIFAFRVGRGDHARHPSGPDLREALPFKNVRDIPAHGIYTASKAGVRALVRVWAQELKDKGIRVNSLSPGATETPIIRGQFSSDEASAAAKSVFASMTPLGRLGAPDELAAGATDESSYVTGIDLPIDGGLAQV